MSQRERSSRSDVHRRRDRFGDKGRQEGRRDDRRDNRGERTNRGGRGDRNDHEDAAPRRQFVPWLGEERPKKGSIIDLEQNLQKKIHVQFIGGREIRGMLVGYDPLLNLVLEDVVEDLGDGRSRGLGKLIARGPLVQSISPVDGSTQIANPF